MQILGIKKDNCPISPRCWDNLGTMVCWHRNCQLGDEHDYKTKNEFLFSLLEDAIGDTEEAEEKLEEIRESIDPEKSRFIDIDKAVDDEILSFLEKDYVILPIYAYEHGGITVSTHPFSCRWDSGQIGWIYCSLEKAKKELAGWKTKDELRKGTEEVLNSEVDIYDTYLQGDVYGCILFSIKEEGIEEIDSSWGFYGNDPSKNGMLDYYEDEFGAVLKDYGTITGRELLIEDNGQVDIVTLDKFSTYAKKKPLLAKFLRIHKDAEHLTV